MKEIWKPIEGFESYEVSNLSRVRRAKNGRIITPVVLNTGYLVVRFSINRKVYTKLLHRIVAKAFIPNPNNYPVVNHINEDRKDARIENLEWCTQSNNLKAHYRLRDLNDPNYMQERIVPCKKKRPIGCSVRFVKH